MITALRICWLPQGALSLFDTDNFYAGAPFYALDVRDQQKPIWTIQHVGMNHRVIIPDTVDLKVDHFKENLDEWLKMVENEGDGTLFFTLRSLYEIDGGQYFLGGVVFIPHPVGVEVYNEIGLPLEGEDARTILNLVLDNDRTHPFIRRFLELDNEIVTEVVAQRLAISEEQQREYGLAMARSRVLLLSMLDAQQTADLEQRHYFEVVGQDGQLYRITDKDHQNVYLIQDGQPLIQYCAIMQNWRIPVFDLLLAQKLLIESHIDHFMGIANKKRLDVIEPHRVITIGPNGPDLRVRTVWEREIRGLLNRMAEDVDEPPPLVMPAAYIETIRPVYEPLPIAV